MSNQELLQESRVYGWPSAESAPPRFAARIIEIRRATVEKRAVPEPSAEYRMYAERNYVAPRRKVNTLPVSVFNKHGKIELSLEERILAQACTIRKDREAYEAAEQKRWAEDPEYQAWLASAERV